LLGQLQRLVNTYGIVEETTRCPNGTLGETYREDGIDAGLAGPDNNPPLTLSGFK
jgi:hypothetical protein